MKKIVYKINGLEIIRYIREKEDNRNFSSCKVIVKDDKKKINLVKK